MERAKLGYKSLIGKKAFIRLDFIIKCGKTKKNEIFEEQKISKPSRIGYVGGVPEIVTS